MDMGGRGVHYNKSFLNMNVIQTSGLKLYIGIKFKNVKYKHLLPKKVACAKITCNECLEDAACQ